MNRFERMMNDRAPLRNAMRSVIRRLGLGSYKFRLEVGALTRPHYAYIMDRAARLASSLGLERISVVEFGVAGGSGLLAMEFHAGQIEKIYPTVKIEIYGFDTGAGLPPPKDYRDLPYQWKSGFFAMDRDKLSQKLSRSRLVFGDATETSQTFFQEFSPAPIAAVVHDMDYYSSTAPALKIFLADCKHLLPRIFCYFDDTVGGEVELYSDYTGQRLALKEFNEQQDNVKIAVPHHLRIKDGGQMWRHQIWVCHRFDHPAYNQFVADDDQQLPM